MINDKYREIVQSSIEFWGKLSDTQRGKLPAGGIQAGYRLLTEPCDLGRLQPAPSAMIK